MKKKSSRTAPARENTDEQLEDVQQPLTPQQIKALPPVQENVIAQEFDGDRLPCQLTPGCDGVMSIYSSQANTKKRGGVKTRIRRQYFRCEKCRRRPVNPRETFQPLEAPKKGGGFDRRKVRNDD